MGGCLYRAVNVCTLWIHSFDLGDTSPMIIWDGSLFWRTPHIQKQARTQKNSNPNHPLPWNLDWWWLNHQQFHFMGDFLIPTLGWGLVSSLRNQPTRGRESPKKIMENTPMTWVESPWTQDARTTRHHQDDMKCLAANPELNPHCHEKLRKGNLARLRTTKSLAKITQFFSRFGGISVSWSQLCLGRMLFSFPPSLRRSLTGGLRQKVVVCPARKGLVAGW